MTKKEIEKALKRHGVVAFDPTGEQFDPNKHEALYQAPVPGKTPGEVLECQEIGCTFFFLCSNCCYSSCAIRSLTTLVSRHD